MSNKELKNVWNIFIKKAKEKGYRTEHIKTLGMLALTKNAKEHFGNNQVAFEHLISLMDKYDEKETMDNFAKEIRNNTKDT